MMKCLAESISLATAEQILSVHEGSVRGLTDLPPGDTRYEATDPKFRALATQDAAIVRDHSQDPLTRLARLGGLLYQVRCSLLHGSKDPSSTRDRMLVTASNKILSDILPHLESAFEEKAG